MPGLKIKRESKGSRPKKSEYHELPYTEIVKSGTFRLVAESSDATLFYRSIFVASITMIPGRCSVIVEYCKMCGQCGIDEKYQDNRKRKSRGIVS